MSSADARPVAVVTGVSRRGTIGAAVAERLARDGWNVATVHWSAYDASMPWGRHDDDLAEIAAAVRSAGGMFVAVEADLADPVTAPRVLDEAATLGPVTGLVLAHAESRPSGVLDTTVESFDRHFAVNVRASWLLIREFAARFVGPGLGRIVAMTSDDVDDNLPYGASKGALDRIVVATGLELATRGIRANCVNPGPTDTGWITDDIRPALLARAPAGRLSEPEDAANVVSFLLSADGGWINAQVLRSDGGWR